MLGFWYLHEPQKVKLTLYFVYTMFLLLYVPYYTLELSARGGNLCSKINLSILVSEGNMTEPWKKWAAMCMRVWAWHLDPTSPVFLKQLWLQHPHTQELLRISKTFLYMSYNNWYSYIRNLSWEFLIFMIH